MRRPFVLMGLLAFLALGFTQVAQTQRNGGNRNATDNDQKSSAAPAAPAPKHDLSGIWGPTRGAGAGIQAGGVQNMPDDGKPEHTPPYSAMGLKTLQAHKPLYGQRAVFPSTLSNDPRSECDPLGFPRADFYQIRYEQFIQNDREVVILYEFEKRWRSIWLDRDLPKEIPDNRWYGYSVGKWADDNTLVVNTIGVKGEPDAWLDETGRPISDQAKIEERFVRVNRDNMEWNVTIDDPVMYTKPWQAMNKFPMTLQPPNFDIWGKYQQEMICAPADIKAYNESVGGFESESKPQ